MRDALNWFGFFVLVCVLIGWAEVGMTWLICHSVLPPNCFWAMLGFPMSLNMCLSFLWLGATAHTKEKREKDERRRTN